MTFLVMNLIKIVLLNQTISEVYIDALNIMIKKLPKIYWSHWFSQAYSFGWQILVVKFLMSSFSCPSNNTSVLLHAKTNSTNDKTTDHKKVCRDFPLFSRMFSLVLTQYIHRTYTKHLRSSSSSSLFMNQSHKSLSRESADNSSDHHKNERVWTGE